MLLTGTQLSFVSVVKSCLLLFLLLLHQLPVNSFCVILCVYFALLSVQWSLPALTEGDQLFIATVHCKLQKRL